MNRRTPASRNLARAMALPGMRWQSDQLLSEDNPSLPPAPDPVANLQQLEEATKHVISTHSAFRRDADLDVLLKGTRREDTYQQHYQGVSRM